jgi:hypothetical protein
MWYQITEKDKSSYFILTSMFFKSRVSSVGIATCRIAGSRFPAGAKHFFFSIASRAALRPTRPHIQRVIEAISPGVKWPVREVDHPPPCTAEVKNVELYLHPPYVFMA